MSKFSTMLVSSKEPPIPPGPEPEYDRKIMELVKPDPNQQKYLLPAVGAAVIVAAATAYKLSR